jgi:hypothetical protein
MSKNKWGVDRFDLEAAIVRAFNTAEDIELMAGMFYDSSLVYDDDRRMNAMMGLSELATARNEKVWEIFCKLFELDDYSTYSQEGEQDDEDL